MDDIIELVIVKYYSNVHLVGHLERSYLNGQCEILVIIQMFIYSVTLNHSNGQQVGQYELFKWSTSRSIWKTTLDGHYKIFNQMFLKLVTIKNHIVKH